LLLVHANLVAGGRNLFPAFSEARRWQTRYLLESKV